MRSVSGATDFQLDGFAQRLLEIRFGRVSASEEDRRRPLRLPSFDLAVVPFGVHENLNVWISPIKLGERARQSHAVIEIENGGHVVVRLRCCGQQGHSKNK